MSAGDREVLSSWGFGVTAGLDVDRAREQTGRSTGTVGRLRRPAEQLLAEDPDPPPMPPERTFYRLVARLSAGKHTFGSARTRRSLAKQPDGPFGAVTAARPGEWTEID